jgi:alpha-galactosidase
MGFDFFKLDFLYASHIIPKNGKTRAQYANECYQFLREILGDKIILGCGANVISSYNNFDYLRVGPDVSLIFDDVWFMRMFHRERISTKVTLQNTIYRSFFNDRLFGNDPDVFLLRSDNIKLSYKQKESLLIINALFGSVLMTSDNLSSYDEKTKELLDYALDLYNNASDIKYERDKEYILISCKWNDKALNYKYNTKKGVLDKC